MSKIEPRCLNVRQPWASLIAAGRKTIEVRSWQTDFRGPLIVVASKGADEADVTRLRLDGPRGATVCVVELVHVRPIVPQVDAGPSWCMPSPSHFAWVLGDVTPLPEISVVGRLGFFEPPANVLKAYLKATGK